MSPRFSRPRLIDANDKQYRAFLAQIMLSKENQRAIRPPRARDLFGGEAEAALRSWLGQHYTLSERRIVEYLEHRGRSAIKKYRELDAVVLPDAKSVHVFEIKASQKALSLRRAAQQLRDTRAILGMLFARVYTTVLLVNTGIPTPEAIAELMAAPDAPSVAPLSLDQVLETLPQFHRAAHLEECAHDPQTIDLLLFEVADIVALAGAEHLHLDWDEEEQGEELGEEDDDDETRLVYTTEEEEDSDDEGSLGAALRQAMKHKKPGE